MHASCCCCCHWHTAARACRSCNQAGAGAGVLHALTVSTVARSVHACLSACRGPGHLPCIGAIGVLCTMALCAPPPPPSPPPHPACMQQAPGRLIFDDAKVAAAQAHVEAALTRAAAAGRPFHGLMGFSQAGGGSGGGSGERPGHDWSGWSSCSTRQRCRQRLPLCQHCREAAMKTLHTLHNATCSFSTQVLMRHPEP